MEELSLRCVKCNKQFPFKLNLFCCKDCNSEKYSNLVFEGGYKLPNFLSKMPFKKLSIAYGAQNTPLIKVDKLSEAFDLPNLHIKDESCLPLGTHKDRRSEMIVNVAIEQKVDKLVCLTAGNAGYSLSRYAARAGIDYTSLVFPWITENKKSILKEWGNILTIEGNRKHGILWPRDFVNIIKEYDKYEREKEWKNIWAVTNSFEPVSLVAYKELFYELAEQKPDYVVAPLGSGDLVIGLWLGIKELGLDTKIIGVAPKDEHPVKQALKIQKDETLLDNYSEISVAEKLTSAFSATLPILYKIFHEKGNIYKEVNNDEIMRTQNILKSVGIRSEYSAVAAFAVFLGMERPEIPQDAKVIIINTGKGIEN